MYEMNRMKALGSAIGQNRVQMDPNITLQETNLHANGAKSMQNFSKSVVNIRDGQKDRIYSSGNPLKMIKNYKSSKGYNDVSMSFKSNASTKDIQFEEQQRFNHIMNEPIENLLSNMEHLSRPVSSNQFTGKGKDSLTGRNRKSGNINTLRAIKKGRAMTAHN